MLRGVERGGLRMSVTATRQVVGADAEAIWRESHESLLGFISRRVGSRDASEDIVQDVMLRINRTAHGVERAEAVGAWVHADHFRRASIRRELAGGTEIEPDAVPWRSQIRRM